MSSVGEHQGSELAGEAGAKVFNGGFRADSRHRLTAAYSASHRAASACSTGSEVANAFSASKCGP